MLTLFLLTFAQKTNVSEYENVNLYDVLGVTKFSSPKAIQKSFKKALVQFKRNRQPTKRDEKLWRQTQFAHDVISNPDSKELYDNFGIGILNQTDFSVIGYRSDRNIAIIQKQYRGTISADKFGGIISYPLQFDLVDFMNGKTKTVNIMKTVACTCKRGGTKCPKCRKSPFEVKLVKEEVTLPKGASDHHMIYRKDLLDSSIDRGASDVVFIAYLRKDGEFEREGVDIRKNVKITLPEIIQGGNYTFENVDGEELSISLDGVQHKEERRIKGKGLPYFDDPKTRGDVILKFFIKFPKKLTKEQKEVVKKNLPDDQSMYL